MLSSGVGLRLATAWQNTPILAATERRAAGYKYAAGAIIRTILRDVHPDDLGDGATLFHEHLSMRDPMPAWLPRRAEQQPSFSADVDLMVAEVNATARDGVSCIVNAGTKDLGQNVERLRAIAMRANIHIVVAGGLHTQPRYPPDIAQKTEDEITAEFLRDAQTERWGAIGEIGSSMPMHPEERKVLRAACKVQLRTGLPLFTHTPHDGCRRCAFEQVDVIESLGVNPRRVCIGHLADIADGSGAETHKALAMRGVFLGFDTVGHPELDEVGHEVTQSDSKKLDMLLAIVEAGYEDHVLLSADVSKERQLKANGGAGYSAAVTVFVPKMRSAGLKEETIDKIVVDNPRRFLAFVPSKLA